MIIKNCRLVATILSLLLLLPFAVGGSVVALNRTEELLESFNLVRLYGEYPNPIIHFCDHSISRTLLAYAVGRPNSEIVSFFGKPAAIDGQIKLPGWPAVCGSADQNWLYRVGTNSNVVLSFHQGECIAASEYNYKLDIDWQHYKAKQLISEIPGLTREEVLKLLGGMREIRNCEIRPDYRQVNFASDEADEITAYEIGGSSWLTVGWRQNKCLGGDEEWIVH